MSVPKFDSTGRFSQTETSLGVVTGTWPFTKEMLGILQQGISPSAMMLENSSQSVHGKYLSAQPDGRAEWNRTVASNWEFLNWVSGMGEKLPQSAHGKYVSAQPDGSVQINRDHAPPGGWEEFTVETRPGSTPGDAHDFLHLKSVHGFYLSAQADGTAQWNRDLRHLAVGRYPVRAIFNSKPRTSTHQAGRIHEILEAVAGSLFVSKSTTVQAVTMLGSASTRRMQATRTMERKTIDGNGFATSMSTMLRSRGKRRALRAYGCSLTVVHASRT